MNDFTYTSGETVDAQPLLENPNISLYCLDPDSRQAVFTELPPGIDLANAPFYYQAQFDHAQRLITVSYEVLHQLADQIPPSDPARLMLIHNIGRCGSTLLSNAFNQLDSIISFSEPDVFSSFVLLRYHNQSELIHLLNSCLRIVFRPVVRGQALTYGLKFRNQSVDIIDLYFAAFPQAKHLFIYRNAVDWAASIYRMSIRRNRHSLMSSAETLALQAAFYNREVSAVEPFFPPALATYTWETYRTTGWLLMMDRYLELFSAGIHPLALRYEDLTAQPEKVLSAIFEYCGLPAHDVPKALRAFEQDAQQNTILARDQAQSGNIVKLPDEIIVQIQTILSRHPVIRQADFRLPGTLILD
ncbi:MAG: hypothetical protein GC204_05090 [Chloroflexi bacterium]|nr:hypothetical protein [Chloroflexota bacterium]